MSMLEESARAFAPPQDFIDRIRRFFQHGDRIWDLITFLAALLVLAAGAGIALILWRESAPARAAFGINFLLPTLDASWNPVRDLFQAWPFIYGTLQTALVGLLIALPISIGTGIFLAELSPPWLRQPLSTMVELLAAVPSVVFGLWGIFVFLPAVVVPVGTFLGDTIGHIPILGAFFVGPIPQSGSSRLAAGMILAIMVIPTIAAVTRDVFSAIPNSQREAALALGATRWETIWQILLPYGMSGIVGAIILGLGRALGETMAVTMVIGNSLESSPSLLRPGHTMASVIANEFLEAVSVLHRSSLLEVGLILFVMTLIINAGAQYLVFRVSRRAPRE